VERKLIVTVAFDHDWLVIGSGFGGSVAALRLAEKGYDVAVLEKGRVDVYPPPAASYPPRRSRKARSKA
jgi:choline dehydrogenase-like flavoprotein